MRERELTSYHEYGCCGRRRDPGDEHPWCPGHAPTHHAVRLFDLLGEPGDCAACAAIPRLARYEWADRVMQMQPPSNALRRGALFCGSTRSSPPRWGDTVPDVIDWWVGHQTPCPRLLNVPKARTWSAVGE